jgi:1-acyl-sn-glycerol-3-phosphate acyltransferase
MSSPVSTTHPVQFKGSALARWILARMGWSVRFEGLPSLQGVIAVYPHTSNWDFVVGIVAKWSIGIPAYFWAKDSLFKVPVFGAWMRWVGGLPIDRRSPRGVVGSTVDVFRAHQQEGRLLWLVVAPEGTRRFTPGWRSGYYQVALGAQVPLALVKFDWGRKQIVFTDFIALTGREDEDYAEMARIYGDAQGYHPQQASPIVPWRPASKKD